MGGKRGKFILNELSLQKTYDYKMNDSLLAALIVALAPCQNTNTHTAKHTNDLSIVLEESNK